MIKINLLPVRLARKKENIRSQLSVYFLSVLFTLLVMTYLVSSFSSHVKSLAEDTRRVQEEISRYNKLVQEMEKEKQQKDLLQKKLGVLDKLQEENTGPVHILDEISKNIPEKRLYLKAVKQDGKTILLEGIAMDNETIASYMRSLAASPYFAGVDLINSAQEMVSGVKLMQFTIAGETRMPQVEHKGGENKT